MQSTFNIHEAKTHFSKLVEQTQQGEEIVIAKAGLPIARLVPYVPEKPKVRPPGGMASAIWIAEDFDAPVDGLFTCLGNPGGTCA